MMRFFAAVVVAHFWAAMATPSVRLELHFMSHCKQCQVHVNALRDLVLRGGMCTLEAGVEPYLNMTIDYYGSMGPDGSCESASQETEHGPTMCATDRYHLCAQRYAGPTWFDFVHCMWMNIDLLKCGNNGHCDTSEEYHKAFSSVYPTCASLTHVNSSVISACAEGEEGVALQRASYARTSKRSSAGFAPVFVNGAHVEEPNGWRKAVDPLAWGKQVLQAICSGLSGADVLACKDLEVWGTIA